MIDEDLKTRILKLAKAHRISPLATETASAMIQRAPGGVAVLIGGILDLINEQDDDLGSFLSAESSWIQERNAWQAERAELLADIEAAARGDLDAPKATYLGDFAEYLSDDGPIVNTGSNWLEVNPDDRERAERIIGDDSIIMIRVSPLVKSGEGYLVTKVYMNPESEPDPRLGRIFKPDSRNVAP